MIITYVVLHYMTIEDTVECVQSILNNKFSNDTNNSIQVVIVDNGSGNNSYELLLKEFNEVKNIHILKSEKNLGFAKGNNIGFKYAKYELKADFIVCLNNDTVIIQEDFNELIVAKYEKYSFFVLGPDIVTKDGTHQNPLTKSNWTFREIYLFRIKRRIKLFLSYINFDRRYNIWKDSSDSYVNQKIIGDIFNTGLHGSCLIFSKKYIRQFDGFYNKTFLYMEEDILKLYADYYEFLTLYTSDISIYHKEDVSTKAVNMSKQGRNRQKAKYLLKSSKLYSKLKLYMMIKKNMLLFIEKMGSKIKKAPYEFDLNIPISYVLNFAYNRFRMLLRGKLYSLKFKVKGKKFFCGKKVKFKCKKLITCGDSVTINDGVYLDALSFQGITLKNNSSIGKNSVIKCSGNFKNLGQGFVLGENSSLAENCFIGATGGVYIGNDVIGGQNIRFHSSNHIFEDLNIPIRKQGVTASGISVGDDCWIGSGAVFCDGVTVGNGCVIGTNTVLTKSFPENSIIVGVPAKVIGNRTDNRRE